MFGRVLLKVNTREIRFVLALSGLGVSNDFLFWIVAQIVYQGIDLGNFVSKMLVLVL